MATGPLLGSKISLISKSEIRYEGILYTVDPKEATVALANVKLCGTESRPAANTVYPSDEIYDYIIFRGSDIKDLHVCPDPKSLSRLPRDPAIVQHSPMIPQYSSLAINQPFASLGGLSPFQQLSSQIAFPSMAQMLTPAHYTSSRSSQSKKKSPTSDAGVQVSFEKSNSTRDEREPLRPRNREPPQYYQAGPARRRIPFVRQPNRGIMRRGAGRGRPTPPTIAESYETDYDFEQANAEFQELENKLAENAPVPIEQPVESSNAGDLAYNKSKSFYDKISCESTERSKGVQRFDWRNERKLNVETFGVSANNVWMRKRRARGGYRRSYRGRGSYNANEGTALKTVTFDETPVIKEVEMITLEEKTLDETLPIIKVVNAENSDKPDWPAPPAKSEESVWNQ